MSEPAPKQMSDEVYFPWHALVFAKPRLSPEEQLPGWTELFNRHSRDGKFIVRAADAAPIAVLGCSLMMHEQNYSRAAELCEAYLALPDAAQDPVNSSTVRTNLGTAKLLSGEVRTGAEILRDVVNENRPGTVRYRGKSLGRICVRNTLEWLLDELGPQNLASDEIKCLTATVLEGWPGHKRQARAALAASTNGELFQLVSDTRKM